MKIRASKEFTAIRIKKGYSITSLALATKVNPSVIFRIEKGNVVRPSTAKKVCDVLGEPFNELFNIKED